MTPGQLRAARALLGWSAERLGAMSETSASVIWNYEKTGGMHNPIATAPRFDRLAAIRTALESAGIEFTNGDAAGVRLRK